MKKLLLNILMFLPLIASAQELKSYLVVWAKDGTKVAYALSEKPKIAFSETDLVITTQGVDVNYPLDNMSRFTYEANDETTIRDLKTDKVSFKLDGESLLFMNPTPNSIISLHALNGKSVFSKTIKAAGEYSFPLSNLNSGIYLVTVNGLTYKIVKR